MRRMFPSSLSSLFVLLVANKQRIVLLMIVPLLPHRRSHRNGHAREDEDDVVEEVRAVVEGENLSLAPFSDTFSSF
jgi:hypothetical protein